MIDILITIWILFAKKHQIYKRGGKTTENISTAYSEANQ